MGALRLALLSLALFAATPARADPVARWRPLIAEASARFGVPETWIARVMRAESAGRTTLDGRPIVSSAGAMGLMQLMPGTWAAMRARLSLGADPHDPRDNILAGTFYLRLMYERFGYPGLFGAYNAGPARYSAHLATGRRLPSETVAYVSQIAGAASAPPPPRRTLWDKLPDNHVQVVRIAAADGRSLLGREIPSVQLAQLGAKLGLDISLDLPPDELAATVLRTGEPLRFPGPEALILKRSLVNGSQRLELTGFSAVRLGWYKAQGCFTEIIRYQTRLFVPVDRAPAVLIQLGSGGMS